MIVPGDRVSQFRLREPHRQRLLDTPPRWGHGGLSEVTFYRTYSRRRPDGTQESWADCVVRVVEGMFSILRTHADQNRIPWREDRGQRLALEAAQRMMVFKWTPPGRGLWMMGTDYVWERGGMALNNCAFVSTQRMGESTEETTDPFRFLMDAAMLGVGPGFDTRGAGKIGVRGYDGAPVVHRVADSREGWVDVVALTIRNAIYGGPAIVPDVTDVRPLGALLRGFGGVASGPRPLVQSLSGIRDVLLARQGQDVDSVTITDVMNLIGKCVVAGNVRRTAEIGFADPDDADFRGMKSWTAHPVEVGVAPPPELLAESPGDYAAYQEHQLTPQTGVVRELTEKYADRPWAYKFGGWRWASNNSVLARVGMDYSPAAESVATEGEPGFFWLELARSHGRLRDQANHRDHRVMGANPCFCGETLVWTADGHRRFDELAREGADVQVLTRLSSGRLAYRTMRRPRMTQRQVRVVRVTLESSHADPRKRVVSSLRCTPEHIFYTRDGREVRAIDLASGERLDSAYRYLANSKGYMRVNEMLEHHIPFENVEGLGSEWHVHHENEIKSDNRPSNLQLMTRQDHNALKMRGDRNPLRRMPKCHPLRRDDVTADDLQKLLDQGLDVYQIAAAANCSRHTVSRRLGMYGHGRNHRVVSVVETAETEDVYCGTVDETERFFVSLGKDHGILVHNCVEQSLESYECCNLVETYPSHHDDYWDYQRSLKFAFMYAKAVTLVGTHWERTNEVVIRNRRIGCSMTGAADAIARVGRTTFFSDWCERAYAYVGYVDRKYSDWLGVRESVKRTSMKPSGTVTLLSGIYGPGAHFPKPTGYRTMRIAADSPIVRVLEAARYRVEPATTDPTGTVVAYFPWIVPEGMLTEEDAGLWEQVRMAADLQYWWADNQVSYTATFTAEEADRGEIARVLTAHDGQLKGISFLRKISSGYAQMPFSEAPRAEVEAYAARLGPLNLAGIATHESEDRFCDGAACVVASGGA